jgi:hypothetical protein
MAEPTVGESRTTTATPMENSPCRLLDLPSELRIHIYEVVFESLAYDGSEQEIKYCTALLDTSRQVFNDASPIFLQYEEQIHSTMTRIREEATGTLNGRAWRSYSETELKRADIWEKHVELKQRINRVGRTAMQSIEYMQERPLLDQMPATSATDAETWQPCNRHLLRRPAQTRYATGFPPP